MVTQDSLEAWLEEVRSLVFNDWVLSKFKSNLERLERFDSSSKIAEDLLVLARLNEGGLVV